MGKLAKKVCLHCVIPKHDIHDQVFSVDKSVLSSMSRLYGSSEACILEIRSSLRHLEMASCISSTIDACIVGIRIGLKTSCSLILGRANSVIGTVDFTYNDTAYSVSQVVTQLSQPG